MDRGLVRVRAILDAHFAVVAAALVVLVLVGGWGAYTAHVAPGTTTERRPGSSWETTAGFDYSARVTEENPVFDVNRSLADRTVYYTDIAPRLNGTYAFGYDASDTGDLNTTVSLSLVVRETTEAGENRTVLWRTERPFDATTEASHRPGERVVVPFSFNVSAVTNRTERIRDSLGGSAGDVEMFVRASVRFRGTVNGEPVERTRRHSLDVVPGGTVYRVDGPGTMTDRQESTRVVTVERTYGPFRRIGAPALFLVSLAGLAALGGARRRGLIALTAAERERLAFEDDRAEFDDWINRISFPAEERNRPCGEAESLGDLVDFAIDTDNSVVENPDDGTYYVIDDGRCFRYEPPDPVAVDPSSVGHPGESNPDTDSDDAPDATGSGDGDSTDGQSSVDTHGT